MDLSWKKIGKVSGRLVLFCNYCAESGNDVRKTCLNLVEHTFLYAAVSKHSIWNYSGLLKKGVLSHQTNTKYVRVVTFFVPVDEPICVLSPPSAKQVQLVARRPWRIIITSVVNIIVTRSLSDIAHLRLPSTTTMAESKKKAPATHPSCIDMIVAAIGNLKEKNGSSAQAIKKYIAANYNVRHGQAGNAHQKRHSWPA